MSQSIKVVGSHGAYMRTRIYNADSAIRFIMRRVRVPECSESRAAHILASCIRNYGEPSKVSDGEHMIDVEWYLKDEDGELYRFVGLCYGTGSRSLRILVETENGI